METMKICSSAVTVLEEDIATVFSHAKTSLDMLAGRSILLTGGAGFLGYLMAHVLVKIGDEDSREPVNLTILENFQRGRKPWLDNLVQNSKVRLIEQDISLGMTPATDDFEYIIHAASIASPIFYRKNPIETIDANVNGLRHILEYSRPDEKKANNVKGVLFFSTSEIYGDPSPEAIPTPETYRGFVSCTGPRACYDESKRLGETLCVNFAQQYDVPVSVARPFNNYGPGLSIRDGRLIPDLARNLFANRDMVLLSNGRATRTFCYIGDAVAGYLKVLTHGLRGEPYNIGTDRPEVSVKELAEKICLLGKDYFGYSGQIEFGKSSDKDYTVDNPNRRCPNISKARDHLSYNPIISLDEGLHRSLVWYRENLI